MKPLRQKQKRKKRCKKLRKVRILDSEESYVAVEANGSFAIAFQQTTVLQSENEEVKQSFVGERSNSL